VSGNLELAEITAHAEKNSQPPSRIQKKYEKIQKRSLQPGRAINHQQNQLDTELAKNTWKKIIEKNVYINRNENEWRTRCQN